MIWALFEAVFAVQCSDFALDVVVDIVVETARRNHGQAGSVHEVRRDLIVAVVVVWARPLRSHSCQALVL